MKANRGPLFLIVIFVFFAMAGILFYGLWKLGVGEWTFLASIVCIITGIAALLSALARLENKKAKTSDRRIRLLLNLFLAFAAAAALFLGLGKTGVGEWAYLVSMAFSALFVLAPPAWFIIQPDLAITAFNMLTGSANAPDDWKALHPIRRTIVYVGTVICLAVGILLLLSVFITLSSR
ncbi:MAG: hypothetical protein JXB85_02265 [Anaerolineales bacterium]|nr:hypothetical protein [Anaerolineales bacterium]